MAVCFVVAHGGLVSVSASGGRHEHVDEHEHVSETEMERLTGTTHRQRPRPSGELDASDLSLSASSRQGAGRSALATPEPAVHWHSLRIAYVDVHGRLDRGQLERELGRRPPTTSRQLSGRMSTLDEL